LTIHGEKHESPKKEKDGLLLRNIDEKKYAKFLRELQEFLKKVVSGLS